MKGTDEGGNGNGGRSSNRRAVGELSENDCDLSMQSSDTSKLTKLEGMSADSETLA